MEKKATSSSQSESLAVPEHNGAGNKPCGGTGMVVPETKVQAFLRAGGKAVTCLLCHMSFIGKKPSN